MGLKQAIQISAGVFVFLILSLSSHAQSLATLEGPVILTLSGEISAGDNGDTNTENTPAESNTVSFDLSKLEALGLTRVITETPWTEGSIEFEGVLMRDILDSVNASGTSVLAIALDDYVVEIPIQDFHDNNVILASRIKGEPIKIRENGPLWIIYPWSESPALHRPHYYARSIWQLKSLMVQP